MAFVSLILSILALISVVIYNFYAWYITAIIAAGGIITGIIGRNKSKRSVANAGIILSVIALVLTIIALIAFILLADVFSGFNS